MLINRTNYLEIVKQLDVEHQTLIAVSKTKPAAAILELYEMGQRDFGENYVQELCEKQATLPADIRWHFIGHLQRNKVKYLAPFVYLIHGVDSEKLLGEINRQGKNSGRVIDVLLQVFIASEETKFGLDEKELEDLLSAGKLSTLDHVRIRGLMGMASNTDREDKVRSEFRRLSGLFRHYSRQVDARHRFDTLSMGMSGDYRLALEEGSNMIRIGSLLFGQRG
ncbi:MAG TPA: YggS family pyridoxal phosphate-dependent enzyme [Flavisolibacter sp.]|nr:YggS family pyridoxal phosphate-dependent enzyme [Flavisolibacter sp.]